MQENSNEVPIIGTQIQKELHDKPALVEEAAGSDNNSESSKRHSQKPGGRERRLQPPVFKERIERFLSKLKIREVKDELDILGSDTKEQQRYTLSDFIGLAINLDRTFKDEVFATAPVNTNFSTEIIGNSNSQQEIRLQKEDGESISLNALLPKGYRFQEADKFAVNMKERAISFMPEIMKSKGSVLNVLHEIGHARNYESGKIEASTFYTLSPTEKLRAGIFYAMRSLKKIGLPVKTTSPQWLKDKRQSWKARDERAAWGYALQEGRALEKQGFYIFAGFKNTEDIKGYINTALMSYEVGKIERDLLFSDKKTIDFTAKFVKQHVLEKKLEEATSL